MNLSKIHESKCIWNTFSIIRRRKMDYSCNQGGKGTVQILGIETSCDETGAAIVNDNGEILGEQLSSQAEISLRFGGVVPSVSRKIHANQIDTVISDVIAEADIDPATLTAIAVTVKPGFSRSLAVGLKTAQELALKFNKPLIPIHHMEAHALTPRMDNEIRFPFVALLISGGHCILSLGQNIDKWLVLAESCREGPGTSFDQVARRMKLRNLKEFRNVCGGKAIEILARGGMPTKYPFYMHFSSKFNFTSMKAKAICTIEDLELSENLMGGQVLPQVSDISASFQHCVTKQLMRHTQRVMAYLHTSGYMDHDKKVLVLSGGVARNDFIKEAFGKLCEVEGYELLLPPPRLRTDNGVMIAWNGIERWRTQTGVLHSVDDIQNVSVYNKCPMGENISERILHTYIEKPNYVKF